MAACIVDSKSSELGGLIGSKGNWKDFKWWGEITLGKLRLWLSVS